MHNRRLPILATTCLLAFCNVQASAADEMSAVAALFDEAIVARNAGAVRERAALLDDETRLASLMHWVLPSNTHSTIRMNGEFTQTNPAPVSRVDSTSEHATGGAIVSPVFDLLDLAKRTNRLPELLNSIDAIPDPGTDEQRRAKAALQTLLHLELENSDEAMKSIDRLTQLVRASSADDVAEMWPETLVLYRCVVRQIKTPGIDDLLAFIFAQRTQREIPANSLVWHNQIAALAGLNGHRETAVPLGVGAENTELTQWVPSSLRRAQTRGQGLAAALWVRSGSHVCKITGHNDDYLFFRSPLTGDFEVQCDVSAFATQAMTAGTFVGNDGDRSHLWIGTFRNSASRVASELKFSGFDDWIHHRSLVRNGICSTSLNGLVVHTEQSTTPLDPWFAVRNWWRMHAAARDVRISGTPMIPDSIDLSAAEDLRGWFPYYEESAGSPGATWENLPDKDSTGQIFGHGGAPAGSFCESLLAYQRPLESVGSVEYEFFYEPGKTEVHPAVDRMGFYLQPDGVRIHWLTDGSMERDALGPDNLSERLPGNFTSSPLPLKPGEWNQLTISADQNNATLHLNGQQICKTEIDAFNDRMFGLFHFSDQTDARVRNVRMRGNWPKTLPDLHEQEVADQLPWKLDADLVKLTDVFQQDFATAGAPNSFFVQGENQPGGKLDVKGNGWQIHRPGGGPWHDTYVNLPFMVHGDFDMEIAYEDLKAVGDEFGCIMLVVELDDDKRRQCRILRARDELQRQEVHSSLSELHNDGGRSFSSRPPRKTEAAAGRMRMARRGSTLYYLYAENDSSVFRVLETEEISDSSSVADGLHFHTMCNGKGETNVLWKSITVRAERLTLKPDPAERAPTNLYAMDSDGTNLRKLAVPTKGFIQVASGEWSSDGMKIIADMSDGGIDTSRVVIMNSDGSNMKDLGPGCMPSLSPDNKEIVFSQPSQGIMKMKVDGTGRTKVDASGWGTQWSPDGKYIAWAAGNNVVLLNTQTNKRSQLLTAEQSAQLSYIYWNLGWSQNSRSIAFKARKKDTSGFAVVVADVDSASGFGIVYDGPDHINEEFSLSPNGRQVLISVKPQTSPTAKLFIVNRDAPADLVLVPGQPETWNVPGGDWNPDGKSIAFSATIPPAEREWPLE